MTLLSVDQTIPRMFCEILAQVQDETKKKLIEIRDQLLLGLLDLWEILE